jgi:hypothetical protein
MKADAALARVVAVLLEGAAKVGLIGHGPC